MAGSIMAYQQGTVSASAFDVLLSVGILAVAYLGGITRVSGAMVGGLLATGGVVYYLLDTYVFTGSSQAANLEQIINGAGLILTAVLNPDGVVGAFSKTVGLLRAGTRMAPLAVPDPSPVGSDAPLTGEAMPVTTPAGSRQ
jgi:branched-chain amino acid transport system permease protein